MAPGESAAAIVWRNSYRAKGQARVEQAPDLECEAMHSKTWAPDKDTIQESAGLEICKDLRIHFL